MNGDVGRVGARLLDQLYSNGKNDGKVRAKGTAYYGSNLSTREASRRYRDRLLGKTDPMQYSDIDTALKSLE
jgi:hypothetical protein